MDLTLAALLRAAKAQIKGCKLIKRAIIPQFAATIYSRLSQAVGKIDCYLQESTTHERHLFTVEYDDIVNDTEIVEIKFFLDLLFAIHFFGLGDFEYESDNQQVTQGEFVELIEKHLKL